MNDELRKNMGLVIGRAIHLHGRHPDDLYEEIMKVATAFCDQANPYGDVDVTIDEDLRQRILRKLEFDAEAETEEIIPDMPRDEPYCQCEGDAQYSKIFYCAVCGNLLPPNKL